VEPLQLAPHRLGNTILQATGRVQTQTSDGSQTATGIFNTRTTSCRAYNPSVTHRFGSSNSKTLKVSLRAVTLAVACRIVLLSLCGARLLRLNLDNNHPDMAQ
jgi:hypothetical protein